MTARTQQGGITIKFSSQRQKIALISTCAVQKQQRPLRTTGNEFMDEIRHQSHSLPGSLIRGRIRSIWGRADSIQVGRRKLLPSSSIFSSKVKPGGSVATSESTPPGSRK